RVADHLVGELYILQIRFESLPFRREELLPLGAKLVEHARAFGLRLPGAIVEDLFDQRFAAFWRSHRLLLGIPCGCLAPCGQTHSNQKASETCKEYLSLWIRLDSSGGAQSG